MATSLERAENEGQVSNVRSNTYYTVKIWWKSVRWILRSFVWKVYFKERNDGVYTFHLKLRRCWTKVHQIFTRCSQMNLSKSEWWYCNSFWNARATNKGE